MYLYASVSIKIGVLHTPDVTILFGDKKMLPRESHQNKKQCKGAIPPVILECIIHEPVGSKIVQVFYLALLSRSSCIVIGLAKALSRFSINQ